MPVGYTTVLSFAVLFCESNVDQPKSYVAIKVLSQRRVK